MVDKETWTNPGKGQVYILTFDARGNLGSTVVRPNGKIVISTEERLLNQDRAATEGSDVFKNGSLTPVRLIESAEDYQEIASNPNLLSEDDMKDLFKLKAADFKKRLGDINNIIALDRMHELATDENSEINTTVAQLKALESRISDVRGDSGVVEIESAQVPDKIVSSPISPK